MAHVHTAAGHLHTGKPLLNWPLCNICRAAVISLRLFAGKACMHARSDFALIAHRGFSSQAPENTFAAFELAVDNSFAAIELDVQLTADGVPVVLHDGELQRVAGEQQVGCIRDLSAEDAALIDVGSWFGAAFVRERIPRLHDVLRRYHGRTHLHMVPAAVSSARPCTEQA